MATAKNTNKAQNTKATAKEEKVMKAQDNAKKENKAVEEILNVADLKKLFVEMGVIPKFSDSSHYVGCGVRANVFSVNALKTRYNVYCSDDVLNLVKGVKDEEVVIVKDGNKQDKTRKHLLEVKSTPALKGLIALVKAGLPGVAIG